MPFWKKMFNKNQAVYYHHAIVQGKPVHRQGPGEDLHSKQLRRASCTGRLLSRVFDGVIILKN